MTTTAALTDPRPAYAAATEWLHSLVAGTTGDQLANPTPCDEFDVRALIQHVVATLYRAEALATVATVEGQPFRAEEFDADSFARLRAVALAAWENDAALDRSVTVPWGEASGREALQIYVNETLVHGWDLAVATGQEAEFGDPALAEHALAIVRVAIPAEIRAIPDFPFGPVVEPRPQAGATERLANWNGRSAEGWVAA